MKRQDITALHDMSVAELIDKLTTLQTTLSKARLKKAAGKAENPAEIRELADDVARIKTIINEKKLAIDSVPDERKSNSSDEEK